MFFRVDAEFRDSPVVKFQAEAGRKPNHSMQGGGGQGGTDSMSGDDVMPTPQSVVGVSEDSGGGAGVETMASAPKGSLLQATKERNAQEGFR